VVGERPAGVFFGRVGEPGPHPRRLAFLVGGKPFRRFQVGEPLHAADRAGRVANVEVPALRGAEIVPPVLRQPVQDRLAAFPQADVRLAVLIHDFGVRGKRASGEQLVRLRHGTRPF